MAPGPRLGRSCALPGACGIRVICDLTLIFALRQEAMALGFFKDLLDRFSGKSIDWDELEESLIRADIGVPMTLRIIEELQQRPVKITAKEVVEVTRRQI